MGWDMTEPTPLEYAGPSARGGRTSRLAVGALVSSVAAVPGLVLVAGVWHGHLATLLLILLVVLVTNTVTSVVALGRVRSSQGRLRGTAVALVALVTSAAWWVLFVALVVAAGVFG